MPTRGTTFVMKMNIIFGRCAFVRWLVATPQVCANISKN
jgi:hypothetical protein